MRLKRAVPAAVICALVAACVPAASASAAKLTINAQPNPITAGDAVVIFGMLKGPGNTGQPINLYHRLAGQAGFSFVQSTQTDASGRYQFTRLPNVVDTNRSWYVTSGLLHSRVVRERVQALVTLSGPVGSTLLTGPAHPYTFTGTVSPAKAGARVVLQRQDSSAPSGDHWATIDRGVVAGDGSYTIVHVFSVPGDATLRVLLRPDNRNIESPSAPLEYQIEQAQNPRLTISGSPLPLPFGQSETISGVLQGGSGMPVTLWASVAGRHAVRVAQTTAASDGSYSFTQAPVNSTFYRVSSGNRGSARLFVGVKDQLTVTSVSATTVPLGGSVTFNGTVAPDKTGHVIYLQRQVPSGAFHTVAVARVGAGSTFAITRVFTEAGARVMRVMIPGGPENIGAASAPVTITVTPATITAPSS